MNTMIRATCVASLILAFFTGCASVRYVSLPVDQRESIRAAAAKVVPNAAKIRVSAVKKSSLDNPTVNISGHLLEGERTEDSNPHVRGDYGTHEKLTRVARIRAFRILKSVLSEADITNVSEITVNVRHGVRVSTVNIIGGVRMPTTTSDVTRLIYAVSIDLEQTSARAWIARDEDAFMKAWKITTNVIPSLEFSTSRFPYR